MFAVNTFAASTGGRNLKIYSMAENYDIVQNMLIVNEKIKTLVRGEIVLYVYKAKSRKMPS